MSHMKLQADLVIFNGNLITMDPENPTASALAVKNFKVLVVGGDEQVVDLVGSARRVIDLGGKTVLPGFIDAHTHITAAGIRTSHVDLQPTRSVEDVKQTLRKVLPSYTTGQWIRGYGYDESFWPEKRYVTAQDLDDISTENPIAIDRVDGHLTSVNTLALKRLGIRLDQAGVVKDKKGRPTGVLRDIEDLYKKVRPSDEEIRLGILAGQEIANRSGITALVDNAPLGVFRLVRECERQELLSARVIVNQPAETMKHMTEIGLTSGLGSPMLKIGGVKSFVDGSIGARTAALSEPYIDDKKNKGKLFLTEKTLTALIKKAVRSDIQTVTHAIGDAAIEVLVSAFENLTDEEKAALRSQRHRIEHAEMISESQIRRVVSLGLILSMQPNFVGVWQQSGGLYEQRLGPERVAGMNMFRVALDNGARLCFGSDGMPYGPLYGIWSATTHPNPKVRLTVEEAVRCYTMESAYSVFMEKNIGSLVVGKRADFVVLSDDIMSVPADAIRDVTVEMTVVGGLVEYSSTNR